MTAGVAELLATAVRRGPDHAALVEAASGSVVSWREVATAVAEEAGALRAAGLADGDRVLLPAPTSAATAVALFAVLHAGGVAVPVAADLPEPELRRLLDDSGARLVLPAALASRAPAAPECSSRGGDDLAMLCYTSATSGPSRGVMLSHRALLANVEQCAGLRPAPVTAADRVLLAVPLDHVYAIGCLLQVARAGATAVLLEPFTAADALAAAERHRVTVLPGVPPMYSAFLQRPPDELGEALSTVRLLTSGGAPLPPEVFAGVRAATGLTVFEGYGLTEAGPVLTSTMVAGYAKPGAVGRPLPGVELRIVDTDGTALPEADEAGDERGGTGLIAVRTESAFSGYWPDGAHGPDGDGWFRTGDIGYLDTHGDLHLLDRARDLIVVNGFNVYPYQVEHVLCAMPGVLDAAVVGAPDPNRGEVVKAVVVKAAGIDLTGEQVRQYCAGRLARFKVPEIVEFTDTLPHSVTGKLAHNALRARQR
ncbi:MAG: AMP-binding protein [Sciscionella sp.]